MKSFEELVNTDDPGWPLVSEWIKTAKNKIEVLPADAERVKKTLIATQVITCLKIRNEYQKLLVFWIMLHRRSAFVIKAQTIKRNLSARKQAKTGALSTVEEKPTLCSLFQPSLFYLIILVVVVLGGLLCIVTVL